MQPALDHTDWTVLSSLLRHAQREGWRVAFGAESIELDNPATRAGVIVLPAILLKEARASGWHVGRGRGELALHHPAVQQTVRVHLGA